MLKSGHEIAAHSYTQDALMAYLSPDEERAIIEKCIGVFKKLTGAPPKGWLSPVLAPTAHTEELIAETGFLWYGDYNNIDLPFCVKTAKGTIVALPHTDFADHRVLRGNPRDWFDVYKDTFDYLYANEPMAFLNVTVHCHFGGRPLMAAQIDRILKYIRVFPGVWLARHDELAEWIKTNADRGVDEPAAFLPRRKMTRQAIFKSCCPRSRSRNRGLLRAGNAPAPCCGLQRHRRPAARRARRGRSIRGWCPWNSRVRR